MHVKTQSSTQPLLSTQVFPHREQVQPAYHGNEI